MTSFNVRTRRSAARAARGIVLLSAVCALFAATVQAAPPKKKDGSATSRPRKGQQAKQASDKDAKGKATGVRRHTGASAEELAAAKEAALSSIGKKGEVSAQKTGEPQGEPGKTDGVQSGNAQGRLGQKIKGPKDTIVVSPEARRRGPRRSSPSRRPPVRQRPVITAPPKDQDPSAKEAEEALRRIASSQPSQAIEEEPVPEDVVDDDQLAAETATSQPASDETEAEDAGEKTSLTIIYTLPEADPEARTYLFNYKDTPWVDVLQDFGRMSGLSYLDVPAVKGNLTYRSPHPFTYDEAMHQLNELLLARPLDRHLLRRHEMYLTVERIADAMRDIPPERMYASFDELEAADLDDFEIAVVMADVPEGWSPYQIIEEFRHMFSDTYGTQVVGDQIELTGLVGEHFRFRDVITRRVLDIQQEPDDGEAGRTRRTVVLKSAKASDVQTILKQLFPVGATSRGRHKRGGDAVDPDSARAKSVTIVPDIRNNTLYLRAPESLMNEMLDLIAKLDTGEFRQPEMEVVKLLEASAVEVAQTLKPIITKLNTDILKGSGDVYISPEERESLIADIYPDASSNSIVIVGGVKGVARNKDLISQYDKPDDSTTSEIIEVHQAKAEAVARLVQAALPAGGRAGQPTQFIPMAASKMLVVCAKTDLPRIKELVAMFDFPQDDDDKEHFVQLKEMSPSEMVSLLQQILSDGSTAGSRRMTTSRRRRPTPRRRARGGKKVPQVQAPAVVSAGTEAYGPRFIADNANDLLIVMCLDEDWPRIEELINKLDVSGEEPVLKRFPLEQADAAEVAAMLQQMFPTPANPAGAKPARQQIFADSFNNTVNIFARQDFIDRVAPFIAQMDILTELDLTVIRLINADAEAVAPILLQTFGSGRASAPRRAAPRRATRGAKGQKAPAVVPTAMASGGNLSIIAEPITNSLFIKAPAKELEQIRELIAEMEAKAAEHRVVVEIENRSADEVAATLQSLLGGGSRPTGRARRGAKAPAAAAAIETLKIVPDGTRIILNGPQDEIDKALELIKVVDVVEQKPIFKKYAVDDPEETETALRMMLTGGSSKSPAPTPRKGKKGAAPKKASAALAGIQIYPQIYEGTLLVRAMPEDMLEVDRIIEALDRDPDNIEEGKARPEMIDSFFTIQLRYRKAWDIAYKVENMLNPPGTKGGPLLEEGPTERTLLVTNCKPSDRARVQQVVDLWDVPEEIGAYGRGWMSIKSENMPAALLVKKLQAMYSSPDGSGITIVEPEQRGGLIQVIDIHDGEEPVEEQTETQGDADQASESAQSDAEGTPPTACAAPCSYPVGLLNVLYWSAIGQQSEEADAPKTPQPAAPQPTSTEPAPKVTDEVLRKAADVMLSVDPDTGEIVVLGSEEQLEIIRALTEQISGDKAPTVYRVFPLKYADVNEAAQLLTQVFNQQSSRTPRQPQRPQAKGQKDQKKGDQKGQKAQQPRRQPAAAAPARIKVIPNTRTRSLFVVAPLSDIDLIIETLRYIDKRILDEGRLKIFRLQNLDASQVAQNLQEVLGLSSTTRRQPRTPRGRRGAAQGQQTQPQTQLQLQGGESGAVISTENTRLTADTQTNSIIAQGSPDTLRLIEDLIKELEKETNTTKIAMRRVQLKNARASEVESIVQEIASKTAGPRSSGRRGPGGRGARGGSSTTVSVNADTRTNSIILAGQVKDLDEIESVVKELDIDDGGNTSIKQFAIQGDAKQMEATLKALFTTRGKGGSSDVVITSNAASGVVLVKAPAPLMAEIEAQVEAIDSKTVAEQTRRPIKLNLADATVVAPQLLELFSSAKGRRSGQGGVTIKGNKSNNTLYVQCPDDLFEEIREVAQSMDKQPEGLQVKSFRLKHASAIGVQKQLETLMAQAARTKGMGDVKLDLVGVLPDARRNALIVSGGPLTFLLIEQVLAEIDQEPDTPQKIETVTYELPRTVIARDVARNITELFRNEDPRTSGRDKPVVTFNDAGNVVTVKATSTQHEEITKNIIEPVKAAVGEPMEDYQVELKYARADEIKPVIEEFMNKWRSARGNKPQYAFTITADPNSNMLLINCTPSTKEVFDKQLVTMDTEAAVLQGARTLKTYALKYANIWSVRDAIIQTFRRSGRVPEREQVNVSLDGNTNSVSVLASEKNHVLVNDIVTNMDIAPGEGSRQEFVYQVENARAVELANTLNNIIRSTRRATQGKYPVSVFGDDATNKLIINGPQAEYDSLLVTIQALDVKGASGLMTKSFTAKYLEPWYLPGIINQQFRIRSRNPNDQVTASYVNGTMSIVVSANPENMAKVEQLIAEVDVPSQKEKITKFFQLKNARADALANLLNQSIRNSEPRPRNGVYSVVYGSEMNTNTLLVAAPEDRYEEIEAQIAELDKDDGGRITRSFSCQYVNGWRMADTINRHMRSSSRNPNDQVLASYDDGSQSIIVTANEKNMQKVAELIEMSDQQPTPKFTRFMQLKHARADEVARTLNEAWRSKTVRDRQGQYPVTIGSDVASNNLIVTARENLYPEIEEMISQLDVEPPGEQVRKIFKLTFADPGSVSRAIRESFRQIGRSASPRDEVRTADDWTTNSVIVTAAPEKMAEIEALITELDKPGDQMRTQHIIELANTNSNDVARSLQQIFDAANRGRRTQGGSVTIRAIEGTTKIAVLANAEEFAQVEKLVEQIDVQGGRAVHTVTMPELVSAESVAKTINDTYGSGRGRGNDGIRAEYHEPTNTLLVFSTDAEFEKVNEQVIQVLCEQPAIGKLKIFKVPLKYAVADEVAQTLQDFFDKKSGKSSRGRRPWWAEGGSAAQEMENQVTIIAEPTSNMLILYCTETTKAMIDDLLVSIDTDEPIGGGEKVMEMVALKYMDATEMLEILTEYLKVSKRTKEDTDSGGPWWARGRGRSSSSDEDKTVLAGDMRLKAVESSNSIIVVGRKDSVDEVLAKIEELDVEDANSSNIPKQIELVNANASELADTLTRIFGESGSRGGRGGSSTSAPTIVAVEATNSLLVKAKPSIYSQIKSMAETLDKQIQGEGGVQTIAVPIVRDVEELAELVEAQINQGEENKRQINRDYRPSLVSISADKTSNTLLVSGSKSKFEEVQRLVDELVKMGPTTPLERRIYKPTRMSPDQLREIIEQLQEGGSDSGSSRGGSRRGGSGRRGGGRRGDATWTQDHRYQQMQQARTMRRAACPMSLPLVLSQATFGAATAQNEPPRSSEGRKPRDGRRDRADGPQPRGTDKPVISTIRPRQASPEQPQQARPTSQPAGKPEMPEKSREEKLLEVARSLDHSNLAPSARDAYQKRLSGARIEVIEGPGGTVFIDGVKEDLDVLFSILDMLDTAASAKTIEYVPLQNSRASDLAKTLQDVLAKIEKVGDREVTPEDQVDIIADPRTNGLYIAATPEKMALTKRLIRQNEEAETEAKGVRTFRFENRRVSEAGEVLKRMISAYLKQKSLPADSIGVEIDPFQNSVLVTGGDKDLDVVQKLFENLDAELPETKKGEKAPQNQADLMIIPLRIADADTLGKLLNELLEKAATGETPMKDFIRRMRLLDENGEPIAQIDLDRPIAVFGDPDSNALIVASTPENCLIMKSVARAFDVEPAKAPVEYRVMTLKYADATEVAEQLDQLLSDSESLTERPGKGDQGGVPDSRSGSLVYKAVVKPDARTNQIVIVGRPEAIPVMEELITALDVKGMEPMPIEIIKLAEASATALEAFLTQMMEERAEAIPLGTGPNAEKFEKVIIKADPRTESLIVAARPARMEELRLLIKKLDVSASALVEDIRTITLHKSNAIDLSEKLKDLWDQRKSQREGGNEGLSLETPAIVADERSNSLIVAASKGDFEAIKAVVDKIEALELNPMANIYLVRLYFNSAQQLAPAFTALFQKRAEMRTLDGDPRPEDEVAIEVDEVTNSLIVVCSRENYDILSKKVEELDREMGVSGQIEFFMCDNVGAYRIKETIEQLFENGGLFKPGATGDSEVAQDREKVSISIDARANMLIVSASPENMDLIREIYKRMNSVKTPWDAAISQLITIEHGDSVKIAAQVQEYFDKLKDIRSEAGGDSGSSSSGFDITIFADERSNRVIIGGTKDGIDSAIEMVRRLDVEPGRPGQITEVYTLNEAPVAKIGEMIDNIFQERNQTRSGATGPSVDPIKVTVETNESTNSLLINASREDHILIADLITRLDRPSTLLQRVRVFALEKAPAEKIKEILDELYQASQGSGGGSSNQNIAVVADDRVNAVIVAAPPGELENLGALVQRLDDANIIGTFEVGVFACENEDAEKMAELLTGIMTGDMADGGGQEQEELRKVASTLISFRAKDDAGEQMLHQMTRENVQITYNVRTNSVIAVAPSASLKLIGALVHKLDRIQKRPVLVKVFHLVNADATKMVDLLEEMFAIEGASQDQEEFQEGREILVEGGTSSTGALPTASSQEGPTRKGTFGRPKTTFVADERTNSILVAGWPEDVDVVADVVDQLDSKNVKDRAYTVYTLVNSKAEDLQTALDSYFQAEKTVLDGAAGDSLSPWRQMEQEVTVVAHEETNQLVIGCSPRYRSEVLSIVEQLDIPPPQVMIHVMIAEVTLDDRFEMGLEFALQELRFSETAVAGGNGVLQSSHFDVIGGTDLGAAGSGLGGVSFTITGEDFNFLVRALQSDSRLEVIQSPSIMCQDNQTANITVGNRVPFVEGTQVSDSGQVNATVNYEDVGVKLDVEPHINPDGFVYLVVKPEISAIADSSIDLGNGTRAPVFSTRTAETTVTVKDGETVVIGGLITTDESESESKVPFLGDIPGLGALFRATTRTKTRTEMLIALTPRIVRTVEDGRRMSLHERDLSGIITDNMKQSPLFRGLQIHAESGDEIDTIDTPPETGTRLDHSVPVQQEDTAPRTRPERSRPEPAGNEYGPKAAPKYGPVATPEEETLVRRSREPARRTLGYRR